MEKNKLSKGSIIGIIIGAIVGIAGIVVAIVQGVKKFKGDGSTKSKKKIKLKDHPTKYKPL